MENIKYSFIIPAYNEELFIGNTLLSLRRAMEVVSFDGEIIVVDNNSTDMTAKVASSYGAKVIFEEENRISKARHCGALEAKGEYLFFIDADTTISDDLFKNAFDSLESGQCCGGGTIIQFDELISRNTTKMVDFWNWFSKKNRMAAGCFIFCTKKAYGEVGGYSQKCYIGEEIFLSHKLKQWGRKHNLPFVILDEHPILTSARKFKWYSPMKVLFTFYGIILLPFMIYSKKFCALWYQRPSYSKI